MSSGVFHVSRAFVVVVGALLALSAGATGAALAQEIVLFEHTDFEGRALKLRHGVPDLGARDFARAASSVRVISGAWTACEEPNLGGHCFVISSDLRDLHAIGFGDRIMSIAATLPYDARYDDRDRDRGGPGPGRGGPRPGGRWRAEPSITLFDGRDFGGDSRNLTGPTNTLRSVGFNDRTSSLRIEGGAWEICSDADFHGRCEIFVRSARSLGEAGWSDSISSLRPVPLSELPDDFRPLERGGSAQLTIYADGDYHGRAKEIGGPVPDLGRMDFRNAISSFRIKSGAWLFCTEPEFRGTCRVFVSDQSSLRPFDMNDRIASIKPAHW